MLSNKGHISAVVEEPWIKSEIKKMAAIVASKVKRQRKESRNRRTESASTVHSSQLQLINRFNHEEDSGGGKSFEVSKGTPLIYTV